MSGVYVLLSGSRICMFVVVCRDRGIRFSLFFVVDIAAPESAMYSLLGWEGCVGSEHVFVTVYICLTLALFLFLCICV